MSHGEKVKENSVENDLVQGEPAPEKGSSSPQVQEPVRVVFKCFVISFMVSILATAGGVFTYDQYFAQKVVAVDLKGFLQQQKDEYLEGKITEDDVDQRMDELEKFVDQIPKNRSVILGDVVVRNIKVLKP